MAEAEAKEKQRSILMTGNLAQMTFNGDKTQTRRVIQPQPIFDEKFAGNYKIPLKGGGFEAVNSSGFVSSRYGNVGDRLFVKELYFAYGKWKKDGLTKTGKPKMRFVDLTAQEFEVTNFEYRYVNASQEDVKPLRKGMTDDIGWYKRPSLFMPRRAARSIVEITELRVERVQDISTEDARAELGLEFHRRPTLVFRNLWNDINKARGFGWDANPWVWAITYKKIKEEN